MSSVLLHELEPLFPRGSGEIDPGVKGPHTHGEPMSLPYPTSILAVLVTALYNMGYVKQAFKAKSVEKWYEDLEELFKLIDEKPLRGPYLYIVYDDKDVVLVSSRGGWVKLNGLYDNLASLGKLISSNEYFDEEYRRIRSKLLSVSIRDVMQERVSISLEYSKKVTRRHYFTTLRLLDYRRLLDYIDVPRVRAKIMLGIDVYVDLSFKQYHGDKEAIMGRKIPVKALGRGRVGVLEVKRGTILEDHVKNNYNRLVGSTRSWDHEIGDTKLLLYVSSPLLLKINHKNSSLHVMEMSKNLIEKTIIIYPHGYDVLGYLKREVETACRGSVEDIMIDGVVSTMGLGYSLRFHKRKPLFNTLLPGSTIYVNVSGCKVSPRDLYIRGLGELRHLGFGTIIPVPIT